VRRGKPVALAEALLPAVRARVAVYAVSRCARFVSPARLGEALAPWAGRRATPPARAGLSDVE
jgi:hypothetical protein